MKFFRQEKDFSTAKNLG